MSERVRRGEAEDISGVICPTLGVYSLGIVLKVRWIQQTLHLLAVERERSLKVTFPPE